MRSRAVPSATLSPLLRSELEQAIFEAALHQEDDLIARRYLVEKNAQIDIAAELGLERKTVSRRLPAIIARVEQSAQRLAQK